MNKVLGWVLCDLLVYMEFNISEVYGGLKMNVILCESVVIFLICIEDVG